MDKIKKNAFWVSMGAAAAVLVIFYVLAVFPLGSQKEQLRRQLAGVRGGGGLIAELKQEKVPGMPNLRRWEAYREQMMKAYQDIVKFYADSDKHLERWFPGLPANPASGLFMAEYRKHYGALEEELRKKNVQIGVLGDDEKRRYGFNWEDPQPGDFDEIRRRGQPGDEERVLKELQKRYWARERVANAILKGGARVTRIHDFRFFRKLHDRLQNAPWEQAPTGRDAVFYQGVGADPGTGVPRNYVEYAIPDPEREVGRTMTFGFALELPPSEVPKVLREILNPAYETSASERLLVNVIGAHVTIRDQVAPEVEFVYYRGEEAERKSKEEAERAKVRPMDVLLTVSCQILDFEPEKARKFEEAQP